MRRYLYSLFFISVWAFAQTAQPAQVPPVAPAAKPEQAPAAPAPAPQAVAPAEPVAPQPPPQVQASLAQQKLDEMNARLIEAFERIAAEYGNPTIVRVFTNDPEKGSELKRRLDLLQRIEKMRADSAELEKKNADLVAGIALRQHELASLQERINKHREALAAFVRMADEAEKAFTAIGRTPAEPNSSGAAPATAAKQAGAVAASGASSKATAFDPFAANAQNP